METAPLAAPLDAGCRELLGRSLAAGEMQSLLDYLVLLARWNRAYNLTAVRDPAAMVTRHLLDSLAVLPFAGQGHLLDAGTGAGLPGVPLAILRPDLQVTLLDSAGKKIRFLRQVKRQLMLDNVEPVQCRLEVYRPGRPPDTVISRAFARLADFARAARPLLGAGTRLLAMKGRLSADELADLPQGFRVERVEKLAVPGLQEQRHLVIMSLHP
jgi:16S rRNA (guanine527-N7)-methyltransferase